MQRFEHFVILLVVVGIGTALFIVLTANHNTERIQTAQFLQDKNDGEALVRRMRDLGIRADFVVDWQKVDGDLTPIQTSLFWRSYSIGSDEHSVPTPFRRIIINGDRVYISAQTLTFNSTKDIPYAQFLQRSTLCIFQSVYGADVKHPADTNRLWPVGEVPLAYRVNEQRHFDEKKRVEEKRRLEGREPMSASEENNFLRASPTMWETLLWQHIWDIYGDEEYAVGRGLMVTNLPPKSSQVRPGAHYYEVTLGMPGKNIGLEIKEVRDAFYFSELIRAATRQFAAPDQQ